MAKKKARLQRKVSRTRSRAPRSAKPVRKELKAIIAMMPKIAANEVNAGLIMGKHGAPSHWLIDVNAEQEGSFAESLEFAKKNNLDLPTRREQSLLFANAADRFQKRWYWSKEEYAGLSDSAWVQDFGYGGQGYDRKGTRGLARLVRRVPI